MAKRKKDKAKKKKKKNSKNIRAKSKRVMRPSKKKSRNRKDKAEIDHHRIPPIEPMPTHDQVAPPPHHAE